MTMTAHRCRTVSTKTRALTSALTAVAATAVAVPAITTAQAEPPAHVRSSTAHTVKSGVQNRNPNAACYEVPQGHRRA
jgi:hypothetical protein